MEHKSYRGKLEGMSNAELAQEYVLNKFLNRDAIISELIQDREDLSRQTEGSSAADRGEQALGEEFHPSPDPTQSLSGIDMSQIPSDLKQRLGLDDKEGRDKSDDGSGARHVDQRHPPSMGTGHRGQVTDPEHDRRLAKNEDEELHQKRVEAGRKGGSSPGGRRNDDGDRPQA